MAVLLIADVNAGELSVDATAKAVAAAGSLGDVTVLCVGANSKGAADEAAKIDGVNAWTSFWYITLPLLKPTTILVSIMSMLQCLKTFSTQYLFTQGGAPIEPINVITLNLYHTAIRDHRIGLASAMSIILFCIMLFFTGLQFKASRPDDVSY